MKKENYQKTKFFFTPESAELHSVPALQNLLISEYSETIPPRKRGARRAGCVSRKNNFPPFREGVKKIVSSLDC